MSAFINLAADPSQYLILEARTYYTLTLEDGLTRTLYAIWHYHKLSGSGLPNLLTWANNFHAQVSGNLIPLLNVRCTAGSSDVRPLDDPFAPVTNTSSGNVAGAVTGDPLSAALAVVVAIETGVRGRSFSGRKHIGGVSESDTDGGDELKAGVITTWQTALDTMSANVDDSAGQVYTPCVLSPTLSLIFGTPPVFTGADASAYTLRHILGTMRKRKERIPA